VAFGDIDRDLRFYKQAGIAAFEIAGQLIGGLPGRHDRAYQRGRDASVGTHLHHSIVVGFVQELDA
jgi:hypothetical protein